MLLSPTLLNEIRNAMLFTTDTENYIAERFGVSRRTAAVACMSDALPKSRCWGCGGMVVQPCLRCWVEGGAK